MAEQQPVPHLRYVVTLWRWAKRKGTVQDPLMIQSTLRLLADSEGRDEVGVTLRIGLGEVIQ